MIPPVPYPSTYWVVPARFLAGDHPGDTDWQVLTPRLSALLGAGIRTFLDLTEEHEMNSYQRALRGMAEDRHIEITYVRIPIPDQSVPSVWTQRRILDVIDRSVADENPVFVHCFAGLGRTGTVAGCYLKRHGLATDEDVLHKIAELRRLTPAGREPSPQTLEQIRMVRHWKQGV